MWCQVSPKNVEFLSKYYFSVRSEITDLVLWKLSHNEMKSWSQDKIPAAANKHKTWSSTFLKFIQIMPKSHNDEALYSTTGTTALEIISIICSSADTVQLKNKDIPVIQYFICSFCSFTERQPVNCHDEKKKGNFVSDNKEFIQGRVNKKKKHSETELPFFLITLPVLCRLRNHRLHIPIGAQSSQKFTRWYV